MGILREVPHQALLFLEWHSSWSNHSLWSHRILSQILFPTACFPPHGISPSLSYFILLTLVSRYFASGYPRHLNHTLIIEAALGEAQRAVATIKVTTFPIRCPGSPPSWVVVPGYFLLDSGALLFFLFSFPAYTSLRINGILILKGQ